MKKNGIIYLSFMALAYCAFSCNSSESSELDSIVYESDADVSITAFSLEDDDSVCSNLSSVFFTIDLDERKIFNADSLPVGSDVRTLIVNMTPPTTASKVSIIIKDGEKISDKEIDYTESSTDSIDFTGDVKIKIVAQNEKDSAIYDVKVNVHKVAPDSIYWDEMAVMQLPVDGTPVKQKAVLYKDKVYELILAADGKYTLSTVANPMVANWEKKTVEFSSFTPNVNTMIATTDALYILSTDGKLYSSTDGISWSAEASSETYVNLYGAYANKVLAVSGNENDGYIRHIYTPGSGDEAYDTTENPAPLDFPVFDTTPVVEFTTSWSTTSQAIMAGGVNSVGECVNTCWGFDGTTWGQINANNMPYFRGGVLVPYHMYTVNDDWTTIEYDIVLMFGGVNPSGKSASAVYYTYDFGTYWKEGDQYMQLPDYLPAFNGAQALVVNTEYTRSAPVYSAWTLTPSRELPVWCYPLSRSTISTRSDYTITWNCPYIYLFGGYDNTTGELHNTIWRAVLNRLSFKPLI